MDFIDLLSIFLPALAFISVLLILFINLYTKIRPNGFATVNCWFCNQWTKVSRELKNSWDCPFCEQYNGFTKDGDYNKPIPEQHDELMNAIFPATASKSSIPDNGLCSTCNNNQELKVQQLAMFSPLDENNFDEEIERYEKQLERAYRLCPQCEIIVKGTLQKQKSILLGLRLSTLRKQGLNFLDLNKSSSGISRTAKQGFFLTAIQNTTIVFAVVRVFEMLNTFDFSHKNIKTALPGTVVPYALLFRDILCLISNCISSLMELEPYLEGIVLQNSISLIKDYIPFELADIAIPDYAIFNIFKHPSLILLFVAFFLQFVFLIFNRSKMLEFIKCVAWFTLLLNNIELLKLPFIRSDFTPQIVEIALCCFIVFCPSSTHKTKNIKKSSIKEKKNIPCENEFLDKDCDNVELLNSTFKSQNSEKLNTSIESNKPNNPLNISTTSTQTSSLKLYNVTNKKPDDSICAFGKQPVFGNPLNTPYYNFATCYRSGESSNESLSTRKSCVNDSLNSYYTDKINECSLPLKENSPNKSSEQEWYKGLSDLHLSTYPNTKKIRGDELPVAFRVSSPFLSRPKPVLSPPRLRNATQSSWVAGGYWKSNDFLNNSGSFSNLSRSSSQSSGFGSQASSQQPNNFDNNIFNSLPSSRTNSFCGEFDKFSVLSEPLYYNNSPPNVYPQSRFYPTLRPNQQIFIGSIPSNGANQPRLPKSPTNVLNDGLWNANNCNFAHPVFSSQRPSSRESSFTQNVLNSSASSCSLYNNHSSSNQNSLLKLNNPFYSHTTSFGGKNSRPLSINPNSSSFSQPYEKGSLLKKWRDQNSTEIRQ